MLAQIERTLLLIKPEAFAAGKVGKIISFIESKKEFELVALGVYQFDEDGAEEFYKEHHSKDFFDDLITYMTSGPGVAIIVEARDAVIRIRELLGDTDPKKAKRGTLRRKFGTDLTHNAVHASATVEDAMREAPIVFGYVEIIFSRMEMKVPQAFQ